jgi:hypothetical protein
MPRALLIFIALLLPRFASAQAAQFAYRVSFHDKVGAPALSAASDWLSARSLARRQRFSIPLDSTDRPVSPYYVDTVLQISGGKFHNSSRWLNQCVVLTTDTSWLPAIRAKVWVKDVAWVGYFQHGLHRVKPLQTGSPKSEKVSPAPAFSTAKKSGNVSYYGASFPQTDLVHGDTLHDQGYRGAGKLIALLDAGYLGADQQPGFDSVRTQGRLLETFDFVHDSSFVYAFDVHGADCLSTMAGLMPGNYVGTAPDASYALYVTDDVAFTDALYEMDNLVAGMERADSLGADIISASLGYNTFTSPYPFSLSKSELDGASTLVSRAVNLATAKGILYVASAGNEGGNNWNFLTAPGDADSALTVGAVTPSGAGAGFSSPGPNAAGRVKPDVCLQGAPATVLAGAGGIANASGTSFSTPQAAGYAACLMQAFPTLPPAFFRETFAQIASLYPDSNAKLGYGIPDFRKAQRMLQRYIQDTSRSLRIYPNPFSDYITLSPVPANARLEARLFDVQGRSLGVTLVRRGYTAELRASGVLSRGVYFLEISLDGARSLHKLLRD